MDLKKHAEAFSVVIYAFYAVSVVMFYGGFLLLYSQFVAMFLLDSPKSMGIITNSWDYNNGLSLILLGTLLFYTVRFVHCRLEGKGITGPDSKVRIWILGGLLLLLTLVTLLGTTSMLTSILSWEINPRQITRGVVELILLAGVLSFVVSDFKRKTLLSCSAPGAIVFLVFCILSFAMGLYILRQSLELEKSLKSETAEVVGERRKQQILAWNDLAQLRQMGRIGVALRDLYLEKHDIPTDLNEFTQKEGGNPPISIVDLVTKTPYEYNKLSSSAYEICGHFYLDYETYASFSPELGIHDTPHQQGKMCYTMDIIPYLKSRGYKGYEAPAQGG